jgi:hypothetical protein
MNLKRTNGLSNLEVKLLGWQYCQRIKLIPHEGQQVLFARHSYKFNILPMPILVKFYPWNPKNKWIARDRSFKLDKIKFRIKFSRI